MAAREGFRIGQKRSYRSSYNRRGTTFNVIIFRFNLMVKLTDVSVVLRPPCWCPSEGNQHGVSIQSSINLGETLFQITRE